MSRKTVRLAQCAVTFRVAHGALLIKLPSGRELTYIHPKLAENRFGGESVTYMGLAQTVHKWLRQETYGGKLTENIVQAVARDCLAAAMLRLTTAGYRIVAHIHDEVVIDAPNGSGSLEEVIACMCDQPDWSRGLVLTADGFETTYYKKD